MGGNSMSKMNLEIIEYIQNADFDDSLKQFFINAIIFEIWNKEKGGKTFSASYISMIENAIKSRGE